MPIPYSAALTREITSAAAETGYHALIADSREETASECEIARQLQTRQAEALVVCPVGHESAHLDAIDSAGLPVVIVDRGFPDSNLVQVMPDRHAGAVTTTRRLTAFGHRAVGVLQGLPETIAHEERIAGVRDVLDEHAVNTFYGRPEIPIGVTRDAQRRDSKYLGLVKRKDGDKDHFLEANVRNGISSMQRFAQRWPEEVPVVWSDFSIGIAAPYPRESIARDFAYRPHHIVREAYLLHSGPNHDRPTWDLTSVLYAVRPREDYFGLSEPGRVIVEDDGFTRFEPMAGGRDRYLRMDSAPRIRVITAQRMLVGQPPVVCNSPRD